MLFVSLLLTALSLLIHPAITSISFARRAHSFLSSRLNLSPSAESTLSEFISFLPKQVFPILLLFRLPLLVLALRQQIFLHPKTPYVTSDDQIRVLSSEQSLTGRIVVAENLRDGYRFLRCDHSILGGRWIRQVPDGAEMRTDLGDS